MSRSLRPRKSRVSYAAMYKDEDGAGPSSGVGILGDDADSGSEFHGAEEDEEDNEIESEDHEDVDEVEENDFNDTLSNSISEGAVRRIPSTGEAKAKTKAKQIKASPKKVASQAGVSLPSGYASAKQHALPTPSAHHRHRAVPLLYSKSQVERLKHPPKLFEKPEFIATNGFSSNPVIQDRLNKAWGQNVKSGPIWQLLEDRGWYKEAHISSEEEGLGTEAERRPLVHKSIKVPEGWEVLNAEEAAAYLPSDTVTAEDGSLKPPPPLRCSFGPFGKQTPIEVNMFDSIDMSVYFPQAKSHVFSAGGPVWGLDWCPMHPDERDGRSHKQYLAIAPFPSISYSPEIGSKVPRSSKGCIQIWSLGSKKDAYAMEEDDAIEDTGSMTCEMVICLYGGPAHEIKWCPLPSHDSLTDKIRPRKLGLLAGAFGDGSVSIYAIPDPLDVSPLQQIAGSSLFVRLPEPVLRIELVETACWSIDWANSEVLAVGCTNGNIAVYNIGQALTSKANANIFPTHYMIIHQSAVRGLAWIRAPSTSASGKPLTDDDPAIIASGGYDGVECLTDIRESQPYAMNRTRDVITCVAYAPFGGGPVTLDHENSVKAYSVSPIMLGRGHTLLEPAGPVWSVSASDYHPQLAAGSADGSCSTTNQLRSTRRGGSVPFFIHKIFQLDYSRTSGDYRMLEHFLPLETADKPATVKFKVKTGAKLSVHDPSTGVWPASIGVHRVSWNSANGLAGASLLASGTACGLCRIDWLEGRWMRDRIPYNSVENIRAEGLGVMELEGSDEDEELDNEED